MTTLKEYLDSPPGMIETIKTAVYAVFIYLGIDMNVTGVLFLLMGIDTLLGVVKTFTLRQNFTFKRLIWGMVTKISVLSIPLTVALMAKGVSIDLTFFVVMVMDLLIVSEAFSSITNMLAIKSKKEIKNADFITMLLDKLRSFIGAILERTMKGLDPTDKK